jgi:hypothetical protein
MYVMKEKDKDTKVNNGAVPGNADVHAFYHLINIRTHGIGLSADRLCYALIIKKKKCSSPVFVKRTFRNKFFKKIGGTHDR